MLTAAIDQARPVYLELPRDMVGVLCDPVPPYRPTPPDPEAVAACADEIMARLAKAERPVVMVDVEVRRYGLERKVAELMARLGIPVVTTFMGRGLLSSTGAPLAGTYLGVAGDPAVTELVEGSDGLLLLGVILSDTNFGVNAGKLDLRRTMQALDRQVGMGFHAYRDIPLAALVEALLARARPLGHAAPAPPPVYPRGLVADQAPIAPDDIARGVNDLFDRHGPMPIAADIGDCLFTAMEIAHTDLTAPGYYAGMGYGVPAGMGAQLATGRRALILVGDGAFQMTGWELGNCRRLGIDPIVILFNNTSWEMLRAFQPESAFNDLDDWRFADIAGSIGGEGRRVTTRAELAAALEHAVADPRPLPADRGHAPARRHVRHAQPLRRRREAPARRQGRRLMRRTKLLKLILHLLLRLGYRYEVRGLEHAAIVQPGAKVLVVVNHVSFLDGALLMATLSEIPVFAINTAMANRWWLRPFRKVANLYPLDPTNPMAIKELIGQINAGQPCVIFPEGRLSVTGALMKIYAGPAYIADRTGATILPVRLDGPELTPFSRLKQGQVTRHWFPKIIDHHLPAAPARRRSRPARQGAPPDRQPAALRHHVGHGVPAPPTGAPPCSRPSCARAAAMAGAIPVLEDTSGTHVDYMKLVAGRPGAGPQVRRA